MINSSQLRHQTQYYQKNCWPSEEILNNINRQDYNSINEFDEILTKCMIKVENMITNYGLQFS